MKELSKQLEEQADLHKKAITRAREAEKKLERTEEDVFAMRGEMQASDILKSGWSHDKNKVRA